MNTPEFLDKLEARLAAIEERLQAIESWESWLHPKDATAAAAQSASNPAIAEMIELMEKLDRYEFLDPRATGFKIVGLRDAVQSITKNAELASELVPKNPPK
jgi:hypothetical protein